MILREMMLEVVIGVLVTEVDKVADEVTDMEFDKVTDMKMPIENLATCWRYFLQLKIWPEGGATFMSISMSALISHLVNLHDQHPNHHL